MERSVERLNPDGSSRLAAVLDDRHAISDALRRCSSGYGWQVRRHALTLSHRFSRPRRADDVFSDSDSLAVCLPLMSPRPESLSEASTSASDHDIASQPFDTSGPHVEPLTLETAVRAALATTRLRSGHFSTLLVGLAYPAAVLLCGAVLLLAASIFLIPEFDRMFDEFGLTLPFFTQIVIDASRWINRFWIVGVSFVVLLLMAIGAVIWSPMSLSSELFDRRSLWALWSWHAAMLIEAGFDRAAAVQMAGEASRDVSIKDQACRWASELGSQGQLSLTSSSQLPKLRPLIATALQLERNRDCALVLRQNANNCWNLNRGKSYWWVALLTPLSACLVGSVVALMIVALFAPLIELITGLT